MKEYIKYKKRYLKLKNMINNQYGGEIKNAAVLLILTYNGIQYVLLLKHDYDNVKNKWGTPGGKIDNNETSEKTAFRELKEETDIDINFDEDKMLKYPFREKYRTEYFIVPTNEKHDVKLSNEHSSYDWFKLLDLINLVNRTVTNITGIDKHEMINNDDLISYFRSTFIQLLDKKIIIDNDDDVGCSNVKWINQLMMYKSYP